MIRVTVDTVRISLKGPERAVLLKEVEQERQLPIFIHATEAEAIANELEGYKPLRPLTHDLLKNCIATLGGELQYVLINDLRDNVFYALLHIVTGGREIDIDARPSDSIALAVRARVPVFVAEKVMGDAGVYPSEEVSEDSEKLAVFRDFVETLGLDDLENDK
jgi:bifunctional DNase/RNase